MLTAVLSTFYDLICLMAPCVVYYMYVYTE